METLRLLLLLVMYCSCFSWPVWARTSMQLSSSLTPGADPLFSSSASNSSPAFMLSFRSPSSSSSSTKLYLCISFVVNVSMPGQCVWTANRDAAVTPSASLTLTSSGNLVLSDSSTRSDIWNSNTSGLNVVSVLLLNSGNLVLVNSTSGYVWQSFHYPTDTLLPRQDFTPQSTQLISNNGTDDFSSGRFLLHFDSSQTLELLYSSPGYWQRGPIDSFSFDELGNVTLFNSPSSINATYVANDFGINAIRRMTLDMDGNLRMYTWNATSAQWIIVWMAFTNVCNRLHLINLCGNYGVCVYDSMQPTCMCPQGFSVADPNHLFGGCKRNYDIDDCNSIKYVEIENIDYPLNDLSVTTALSIDECKKSCSSNCNCMVGVYWQSGEYGKCWLKNIGQMGYSPGSQQHRAFLKISALDPLVSNPVMNIPTKWSSQYVWQPSNATGSNQSSPNQLSPSQSSNKYLSAVIALAVAIAIVALCFAGMVTALISRYRRQLKYMKLQYGELEWSPLVFSYEELRVATRNFSHKLGAGGFGTVYRGQLQNGKVVAVKQLEGISQQEKQFRAEIMTIGRIHHINLLPLVGFCSEGAHRLLVYEYMEIGSLDQVLFAEHQQTQALDWRTRFQICLHVARGIHYLHEECLDCILHCDIKPQNILLDGSFSAKVADFGLAYLYRRDHTVKTSTIRGTRGYLAPEWVSNLPITSKADVYSYGMLIMEIVSGRSNYLYTESAEANERWCFPKWAYGKRVEDVMDTRLDQPSTDMRQVEAVLKVGYSCIQSDMNARPSMGTVVQMLEGSLPIPDAPPPSLFSQGQYPSSLSSSLTTASAGSASWQALSAR